MTDRHQAGAPLVYGLAFALIVVTQPGAVAEPVDLKQTMRFAAEMARGGSWREAQFRWRIAQRQEPENARVLNNLAVASEALGRFEEAAGLYDRALARDGEDSRIRANYRRFERFWNQLKERENEAGGTGSEPASEAPLTRLEPRGNKKKGKIERVTVALPVPPRLELEGEEKVLVASFLADETELLDVNRELARFLRAEFRKRTSLSVLDISPPPAVPEQTAEDLLANAEFWKHLHREYGADLIVSGLLTYDREDASGFEERDIISPTTGQKVRRMRFVEREQFLYSLDIFFIDGATGALRFRERLQRKALFRGSQNDPITAFYELSESIAEDVLAVVISRSRNDTRIIFKS
jgi:hypothetical protein